MSEFPQVDYSHLPRQLADGFYYIGQVDDDHSSKCIESYLKQWSLAKYLKYNNRGTVHDRINKGWYIKSAIKHQQTRLKVKNDILFAFRSAYANLVIFDKEGQTVCPYTEAKYC